PLLTCLACGGVLLDRGVLAATRLELDAHIHATARPSPTSVPPPDPPDTTSRDDPPPLAAERFPFDDPLIRLYALPAAFALAALATFAGGPMPVWIFVDLPSMVLHELGHAVTAWIAGRFAVPIPFLTVIRDGRSATTTVVVLGLACGAAFAGYRSRRPALIVFGAVLALLHVAAFALSESQAREWFLFGGCAGHILFSTLLVVAFYVPLPDWLRWDFWRFAALLFGATGLLYAAKIWFPAARDASLVPMGSAVGDKKDGDMSILVARFGWTPERLASVYAQLTLAGIVLVACVYAGVLVRWRIVRARTSRR
ncbi:MAG: hypothetical protein WBY94_18915, partial [Polyangiaceae bacterium]